jgi:putative endonuclease
MNYSTIEIGKHTEKLAIKYLENHNLLVIEQNFRSKFGEIDIICHDEKQQQIVFVEVRYRKSTFFGHPAESINKNKQRKLINTAKYYILTKMNRTNLSYRFDIIACSGPLNYIKIDWIINAFN